MALLPTADQNRSNDVLMPEIGMTALSLTAFLALLSKGLQADEGAVCRPCSAVFGVPWRRKEIVMVVAVAATALQPTPRQRSPASKPHAPIWTGASSPWRTAGSASLGTP